MERRDGGRRSGSKSTLGASANSDFSVSILNYESLYSATQTRHRRP